MSKFDLHKTSEMALVIFVLLLLFPVGLFSQVRAQNDNSQKRIFIISAPSQTTIQLRGAYIFIGKTPFTVAQNLTGPYKLIAAKRGFEKQEMEVYFNQHENRTITLTMHPLSRGKAFLRSLALPGWGQSYKGAPSRGLFFRGLVFGAGVGMAVTYSKYHTDLNDVKQAREKYLQALNNSFIEAQTAWNDWQSQHRQAQNSYNRYNRARVITTALWTLNVLDVLFMFPDPAAARREKGRLTSRIGLNDSQLRLTIFF